MFILGIGCAYPETIISNPFLAELSPESAATEIEESTGILQRRSVLTPDYLRSTKNSDVYEALAKSSLTTTELGAQAAEMAIKRAGITRDLIGLVIAECSTTRETIPTEAQRIAKQLGLKITSYDIFSSSASLPLVVTTLSQWKDEKIPDYVLFVSTNTPTQRVDYRAGLARLYFGDGAAAVILSRHKEGKLRVAASSFVKAGTRHEIFSADIFQHGVFSEQSFRKLSFIEGELLREILQREKLNQGQLNWIGTQMSPQGLRHIAEKEGLLPHQVLENVSTRGNILSTSQAALLSEQWERLSPGSSILVTQVGAHSGHLSLEVR